MIIYIYNLFSILTFGFILLYVLKSKRAKIFFFIVVSIQLILIIGLRGWDVGWDTRNYIYFFDKYGSLGFGALINGIFELEKGYLLFQYFIYNTYNHPTFLFLVIAFLYISSVSYFIYNNSTNPLLSYTIFISMGYFTFSMTALRQAIAIAIILFSYKYLKERKVFSFIFFVLIASTFHFSALAYLPFYILSHKKITRLYLLSSIPIIVLAFFLRVQLFNIFTQLGGYDYNSIDTAGPKTLFLLLVLIFISAIFLNKLINFKQLENKILFNALFIGILFTVLAFIHPAALRVSFYFTFFILLFIPKIISSLRDKSFRKMVLIPATILLIILYFSSLNSSSPFIPYEFFWN
jgi:hypothetical protein